MTSSAALVDLVPPTAALRASLEALQPRLRSIGTYCGSLGQVADYEQKIFEPGMEITLPNPFAGLPQAAAAIRRAKSRSQGYGAGNQLFFQWWIVELQYAMSFGHIAGRIEQVYAEIGSALPRPEQRTEVMSLMTQLIQPLAAQRKVLLDAEKAFLRVLPELVEDRTELGSGAAAMSQVITTFEKRLVDQMIKYALSPITSGLAKLLDKVGRAQLQSLRQAQSSVTQAAADGAKAAENVASIAGHTLTLMGKYEGVADTLRTASDAAFTEYIGNFQIKVAIGTWAAFQTYITENMLKG